MLGIWVGQFFAATPLPLQSSFRKRHFWKLGTSAGLQKIGICQNELKFYVTVDRIIVPHIRLIQLEIIELNIGQSNLSTFEKLKDFSLKLKKCISCWKNKNMKWNDFDCSSMWCVLSYLIKMSRIKNETQHATFRLKMNPLLFL